MNIKHFLLLASITVTTGLFGNELQVSTQDNKQELSIQEILLKLKNKELNVGDMVCYEKNEYRVVKFENYTDVKLDSTEDSKENKIILQKSVTLFGIKIATDHVSFSIHENIQDPSKSTIEFEEYRHFNETWIHVQELGLFGTCAGLTAAFLGILAHTGAKRIAADIAYYQSRK